jgi:hypothetical protein
MVELHIWPYNRYSHPAEGRPTPLGSACAESNDDIAEHAIPNTKLQNLLDFYRKF